ncbi:hypothetical protein [Ectopseudomonas alcaliphila]|uniref:hypothetical protein n=1 Tax=Ectopseudomonas alcaliphila TaxID=101564 RepID=UPI00277D2D65|nr:MULTISPECIES: hypothetical protein [Pseudomonas]MDP9939255.1 hypothetical protein [Pseudomonas sp. 3400]MDR7011478.1 hypothetical protein [Pseudomonas alcaliphila]
MQDASSTPTAQLRNRIVVRLQKELRTRRFVVVSLITLGWLVALLIVASREGHGLFDSTHTVVYKPFQLPGLDVDEPLQPAALAGTLSLHAGFGSFYSNPARRDWFELLLAARGSDALMPETILAIDNIRLFAPDGTQLCAPELRLDAPQRPVSVGIDADLVLSQELAEYPTRAMAAHRFELFWTPMYSPACAYQEPAWVLADVLRKVAVAQEEPLWLALSGEESVIRVGESRVTARPGAVPGEWWVEVVNLGEETLHFMPDDYPAHQAWHRVRYASSPYFDSAWDRLLRGKTFLAADMYQLRFEGTPPARLPIRLWSGKEERLRDVRFSKDDELRSDPSLRSTWHLALAHTDLDMPTQLPLQAQGREYHEVFLPISLSAVCQLRVVSSEQPLLRWRATQRLPMKSYRRYSALPPEQLDQVRWELQGSDGELRFFHDVQVESELSCPSGLAWQALPYQAGEAPWLVAAAALPSALVQPEQPARELFGRLRFLDANGQALMPVARSADLDEPTVEDFLFPGGVFKFHGEVRRIEQLTTLDATPRTVRWTYRFMQLEGN